MFADWNQRIEAMRRRARREYWIGVATLVGLGFMQVPFLWAAWRLFSPP
jgi:hypothetical protein